MAPPRTPRASASRMARRVSVGVRLVIESRGMKWSSRSSEANWGLMRKAFRPPVKVLKVSAMPWAYMTQVWEVMRVREEAWPNSESIMAATSTEVSMEAVMDEREG